VIHPTGFSDAVPNFLIGNAAVQQDLPVKLEKSTLT
jgi:hypothetical protein